MLGPDVPKDTQNQTKYSRLRRQFEEQYPELFNVAVPENKDNRGIWDNVHAERRIKWLSFIESIYGPCPEPLCKTCNEAGWVAKGDKAILCPSCQGKDWEKIKAARRREFSNIPKAKEEDSFANFKMRPGTKEAFEAVGSLANGVSTFKLLLLYGPHGGGKTHLCHAAVNHALERGQIAAYWYLPNLFSRWRAEMVEVGGADILVKNISTCEFLVLDDIGVRETTPAQQALLEQIINTRYHLELPLLATTNTDPREMGEAIMSRFNDAVLCQKVKLVVSDYRPLKR